MYGKAFASMYTGSMRGAGLHVFAVWNYCIANCDMHGEIEINPELVAFLLGCKVDDVANALDYLTSPDPKSRTKEQEGRRMLKVSEFGYQIVNYDHYRKLRSRDDKREYDRIKKQEERDRLRAEKDKQDLDQKVTDTVDRIDKRRKPKV